MAAHAHAQGAPAVQLRLSGTTTTSGAAVTDEAAIVRFLPTALPGFDPNDASKLFPFASEYAIIAPVIERDGAPYRLSVNSLPDGSPGVLTAPILVPVDFFTTSAGQFTIGLRAQGVVPAGWAVTLRDYTTGAVTALRGSSVYSFSSSASSSIEGRFQLVITPAGVVGQPDVAGRAGWRLLSAPVDGVTVGALSAVNLVQGVPAGGGNPQPQYPEAGPNLFTGYTGPTADPADLGYTAAPSTGFVVEPGRGFFWRFYDQAITPAPTHAGGGTSVSRDLTTGAVVDLQASEAYAFDAMATAWTERFELRLASTLVASEPDADEQPEVGVPTPNPARGVSRIAVRAARAGRIVALVVDALGRTVRVAFDAEVAAGAHVQVAVDASGLAPGAYSVRLSGPGLAATRRLVVVR